MRKEKILILTLGTGSVQPEQLEKAIETGVYPYRLTKYLLCDEKTLEENEYVAAPLIRAFTPDKVVIIGTVKSSWTSFYMKFGTGNEESIRKLYELETSGNKEIKGERLSAAAKEINKIYNAEIKSEPFDRKIDVQVILTRYGIDKEQLLENYELISGIGDYFEKNVQYEIAFDITHSFRSLPIYNLVILNYFKSISEYDIRISHIYYGNVEVCRENNGIAQIVDLGDLVDVMELTNGVSEFRNTGNAVTLLQIIPEEEIQLKKALEKFDWATQINAFDKIEEALQELLYITETENQQDKNKYADLRKMIRKVVISKFFEENGITFSDTESYQHLSLEEKKFAICKWYLKQNRYGQAIATGMETLRSLLVPLYLNMKNMPVTIENCENENHRKAAVERLKTLKGYLKNPNSEIEKIFYELEKCRRCAVPVRNSFAHNLKEKVTYQCEECKNKEGINEQDYYCSRIITAKFIRELERFYSVLRTHRADVYEVYQKDYKGKEAAHVHGYAENICIVISNQILSDYSRWKMTAQKKEYTVYRLDEKIMYQLRNDMKSSNKQPVKNALFLKEYLTRVGGENANLRIIFEGLNMRQILHYAPLLQYAGIKVEVDGKVMPKLEYAVDYDAVQETELGTKLEELLKCRLVLCR